MSKLVTHIYFGRRPDGPGSGVVTVATYDAMKGIGFEEPLNRCHDIRNHSPDGFEWGYFGSGPAQLALALCVHALTHEGKPWAKQRAERAYQYVKERLIAKQRLDTWTLNNDDVLSEIERIEIVRPLEMATCDVHKGETYPFTEICPKCLAAEQALCPHCGDSRDGPMKYEGCQNFHC